MIAKHKNKNNIAFFRALAQTGTRMMSSKTREDTLTVVTLEKLWNCLRSPACCRMEP